jgi:alginate O-acetyltransferase complex protein AlgJ
MKNLTLARLPIFACAGLVLTLFLVNLWNFAVGRDWPKLRIRSSEPLWGVPGPKPVPWTLDAFLDGEAQKALSTAIGQTMPVFPLAVRAKNQFLYSVFDASGAPNLVVGKEKQLFETFYVREFCDRGGAPDLKTIGAWADRIRDVQSAVEAKGKGFVYLVSPSKAARHSRYLPAGLYCASVDKGTSEKLAPYRAALDARGVNYVDGASLVAAAAPQYPIDLFPRGGTHWNDLGSAVAARALTHALNRNGKASPLPPYDFDWSLREEARGADRDLLNLLNLIWPDAKYPTAAVAGKGGGDCAGAPKLLAVGGSFLVEIVANLAEAPCGAAVDYWHYVHKAAEPFARFLVDKQGGGGAQFRAQPSATPEDFAKAFANAQVVLLEENESVIADMAQVSDLLAAASR